jgi:pSer/pThr/pTyr-binding forkhead associated (FHA) protein
VRSAAVAGATANESATSVPTAGSGTALPWVEVGSTTYALSRPVTRIGRGSDTDLRIDDPGISRHHAELRRSGGDVTIVDLGSTNGIEIDGRRVDQERLRDGAEVRLGSTTMTFHQGAR